MEHLWLYTLLVFGIVVIPGMDMAYVLASSLSAGRRAGVAAVGGIVAGGVVHLAMGSLGVGVLLQLFPAAFNTLLTAGALYVAWMGWSLYRAPHALGQLEGAPSRTSTGIFVRAVATCLLNPKAYVFMIAVFPQFLRRDQGSLLRQALLLGAITAATQIAVYGSVAWGAGGLRAWLRSNESAQIALARAVGALLIITAAWTLWRSWRASSA